MLGCSEVPEKKAREGWTGETCLEGPFFVGFAEERCLGVEKGLPVIDINETGAPMPRFIINKGVWVTKVLH